MTYYQQNKKRIRAYQKKHRKEINAYYRKYRLKNRKKIREYNKEYMMEYLHNNPIQYWKHRKLVRDNYLKQKALNEA
jgi:hypothetical protein